MPTQPQHGYLLVADITGYTSCLAGVRLDPTPNPLTDPLELIVARLKPALPMAKWVGASSKAVAPAS